jgi:peptide chain release factor subunit 1
VKEKKLITTFFNHIALDTHEIVYGLKDTMKLVENNIVKELIVYEELEA